MPELDIPAIPDIPDIPDIPPELRDVVELAEEPAEFVVSFLLALAHPASSATDSRAASPAAARLVKRLSSM
jgi:hypothetical protein